MLGPMVNPAFPPNQMVGVFNLELQRLYGYLYQQSDKNYSIVHGLDGYDEISLTGDTKVVTNHSEVIVSPKDMGLNKISAQSIYGGNSVEEAAKIFVNVITGEGSIEQKNVVCANAGLAIATAKKIAHREGIELAVESLDSGRAKEKLDRLIALSK